MLLALFFNRKKTVKKELITSEGHVEMNDPWQLCRIIGPLFSQRFLLASAKAQPRGDLKYFEEGWCPFQMFKYPTADVLPSSLTAGSSSREGRSRIDPELMASKSSREGITELPWLAIKGF